MRKFNSKLPLVVACLVSGLTSSAYDFDLNGLYYNITSEEDKTVEVTYQAYEDYDYVNDAAGDIVIPSKVTYNGEEYTVTSIGDNAFEYCEAITSIVIPNTVTYIGDASFDRCFGIKKVDIPNSVTKIADHAFSFCLLLQDITIGNSVAYIGDYAFRRCTPMTTISLPSSVEYLGQGSFIECTNLATIEGGENIGFIGASAFDYTAWNTNLPTGDVYIGKTYYKYKGAMPAGYELVVADGTKGISPSALYSYSNIVSVSLPNTLERIGAYAFFYCNKFSELTIPSSVTYIDKGAFSSCHSIAEVTFNATNCTFMADAEYPVFNYARGLEKLTIGKNVTNIPEYAFFGCNNITEVHALPNEPIAIKANVFQYFSEDSGYLGYQYDVPLFVPKESVEKYQNANVWKLFETILPESSAITRVDDNNEISVIANHGSILVEGLSDVTPISVYTLSGQKIYNGTTPSISIANPGLYIVRVAGKAYKVMVK